MKKITSNLTFLGQCSMNKRHKWNPVMQKYKMLFQADKTIYTPPKPIPALTIMVLLRK